MFLHICKPNLLVSCTVSRGASSSASKGRGAILEEPGVDEELPVFACCPMRNANSIICIWRVVSAVSWLWFGCWPRHRILVVPTAIKRSGIGSPHRPRYFCRQKNMEGKPLHLPCTLWQYHAVPYIYVYRHDCCTALSYISVQLLFTL